MKNNKLIKILLIIHSKLNNSDKYKMLELFYNFIIQLVYGGYLPRTAQIRHNIYLPHGLNGIFISGSTKIGENCTILLRICFL